MRLSYSLFRNGLILTALASAFSTAVFGQGGFAGPGWYQITSVKTGQALTLAPDGRGVVQMPPRGTEEQAWSFDPAQGGFFFIRNGANGNALEPTAGQNSSIVLAAPWHGGVSQQWRLEPGKDGNPLIVNYYGRTLDIPNGDQRRDVPLQIYDRNGDSNQRFILTPARGDFGMRWRRPPAEGPRTVACGSEDGRRRYCEVPTRAGVRLARQIGGAPCQQGATWGWDARGIWVDRGCRAEFEILAEPPRAADPGRAGDRPRDEDIVRCSSENGRRVYCQADTRGGVRLARQLEGRECRQGESWGFDRGGIWVDRGCRAEFVLTRR